MYRDKASEFDDAQNALADIARRIQDAKTRITITVYGGGSPYTWNESVARQGAWDAKVAQRQAWNALATKIKQSLLREFTVALEGSVK